MWYKIGYVIYGPMLNFYLWHGVQMTHIYCIITFRVVNWLNLYIEINTAFGNEAKRTGNTLGNHSVQGDEQLYLQEFPSERVQADQPEVPQHNRGRDSHTKYVRLSFTTRSTMGTLQLLTLGMRRSSVTS